MNWLGRHSRRRLVILAIGVMAVRLTTPSCAYAWHRSGHYASAYLAWKSLGPCEARRKISALLAAHPHCALYLDQERPDGVDVDEWRFVRAAQWPDWVGRPAGPGVTPDDSAAIAKYHHPSWHFVNLPLIHADDVSRFSADQLRDSALLPFFDEREEPRHALAALDIAMRDARDPSLPDERRAVAFCWIMHITADLHQPLHCCTLIATDGTQNGEGFPPPTGDFGGNRLAVRAGFEETKSTSLHSLWDGHYLGDRPYLDVREEIERSQREEPVASAESAEQSSWEWAKEGYELARTAVYRDGERWINAVPIPAAADAQQVGALDAPAVSQSYLANVDLVSRRRLLLSGERLAQRLKRSCPSPEPAK